MTRSLHAARMLDGSTECRDASRILTWLRRHPESPRSHVAHALHLSAETVARALDAMTRAGLVEVAPGGPVTRWRCR